jgi:hypothetical protein
MNSRFLALAALAVCVVLAIGSTPAQSQTGSAAATNFVLHPNGPEAFSKVPPLTPEEHEMLDEKLENLHATMLARKGQVAAGPQVAIARNTRETKPAEVSASSAVNPGDFFVGSARPYTGVGDGQSTVAEPSIANSGQNWFVTQNWSRGYSLNAGNTFTIIPDDAGPSDAPFFCCDQEAVHDHGRNLTVWEELFVDAALTTGVVRIHVRNAANTGDSCTYDLNGGAGVLFDYPHLGLGNNFIYISANGITNGGWTGAIMWRYNLDQLAACQSINGSVFTWTGSVGQVVWVPARNTTDNQYMVTIENASQLRYFVWAENSNTIFWNVLNVPAQNYGAATCTGGTGGNNWLAFGLSTSSIGFQTRTAVAQDGSAGAPTQYLATYIPVNAFGASVGRPQAFVAGSIIGTERILTATGIDSGADIFNGSTCFSYSDVTANSRGDLGLIVGFGGSTTGGSAASSVMGISDDYTRGTERGYFASIFTCAGANTNPTRWGDYLTVHPQEPVDVAFTATGFGDVGGIGKVEVCEFMRGRYQAAYQARRFSH